jgi:hypothetical protein
MIVVGERLFYPCISTDNSSTTLTAVSISSTLFSMRKKHRNTFDDIFSTPVKANITWADIEALLVALGAEITEGSARGCVIN